ncbi:MAG: hypothetical protein R2824_25550 [Saprospiraceae bacterium]|nr:hypothetical protein [Lewinella sp.]
MDSYLARIAARTGNGNDSGSLLPAPTVLPHHFFPGVWGDRSMDSGIAPTPDERIGPPPFSENPMVKRDAITEKQSTSVLRPVIHTVAPAALPRKKMDVEGTFIHHPNEENGSQEWTAPPGGDEVVEKTQMKKSKMVAPFTPFRVKPVQLPGIDIDRKLLSNIPQGPEDHPLSPVYSKVTHEPELPISGLRGIKQKPLGTPKPEVVSHQKMITPGFREEVPVPVQPARKPTPPPVKKRVSGKLVIGQIRVEIVHPTAVPQVRTVPSQNRQQVPRPAKAAPSFTMNRHPSRFGLGQI